MATWELALFPATVDIGPSERTLLFRWSNGPSTSDWAAFIPPVAEEGDTAYMIMYQANASFQNQPTNFPGHGNVHLEDLSGVTTDASILIIPAPGSASPFLPGSVSLDTTAGTWQWPNVTLTPGQFRFTVDVTVNGQSYKGDPEMIVGCGKN